MADDPAPGNAASEGNDEDAKPQDDAGAAPRANGGSPTKKQEPSAELVSAEPDRARRTLVWCVAFLAPCAVIALGIFFIVRGADRLRTPAVPAASAGAPPAIEPADAAASAVAAPPPAKRDDPGLAYDDTEPTPKPAKRAAPKHFATVHGAANESCSTASVEGLSRQIIEQARCIKRNAFVPLPSRPNLVLGSNVFPYLELETRDHLLRALDAHRAAKMTINSALRTVAQQYLVRRWAAAKRCGVQLATSPGESNHETGTALDIAEPGEWRPTLEAQKFRWLGAADRVHFDYSGSSAPRSAMDVMAFQTLWNKNHPTDVIAADGRYNAATEERL
jgi:hypothetical protein